MSNVRILMVFVDGLGWGDAVPGRNPLADPSCRPLADWLAAAGTPIDAGLGVPGLPQSATGQTSLLTGINAAAHAGRHVEGFPGPALRPLIESHNLFRVLRDADRSCTFANAYYRWRELPAGRRLRSVTTVAARSAFGRVRDETDMLANRAVYHDLTRDWLRTRRGYDGPRVTAAEAGRHLAEIAEHHDFTLFEFFESDRAGHAGDHAAACAVLAKLQEALGVLRDWAAREDRLLLLTSDHGNVEDLSVRTHTANPVPFVAEGAGRAALAGVRDLTDIAPALYALMRVRHDAARDGSERPRRAAVPGSGPGNNIPPRKSPRPPPH